MLKSLAAYLPAQTQQTLKRVYWRHKIKHNEFSAGEPDFYALPQLLKKGDIAIDVGANVGQYTRRMSELVGETGRVISMEPMSETFGLLTSNCSDLRNVTLLNMAASSEPQEVEMALPAPGGVANYYRAAIMAGGSRRAMAINLDVLSVQRLALIKIDAEGHDLEVLRGAERLLERFRPRLIVEVDRAGAIAGWLAEREYLVTRLPGSPNIIGYHKTMTGPVLERIDDERLAELERSAEPKAW